jgi:hypothetical protein
MVTDETKLPTEIDDALLLQTAFQSEMIIKNVFATG